MAYYKQLNFLKTSKEISTTGKYVKINTKNLINDVMNVRPLVMINPEPIIMVQQSSWAVKLALFVAIVFIIYIFNTILFEAGKNYGIFVKSSAILFMISAILTGRYYFRNSRRTLLVYKTTGQNPFDIFFLNYDKKNQALEDFIAAFDRDIKNARVNYDRESFVQMQDGIKQLEQHHIISSEFLHELDQRIISISNSYSDNNI